MIKIAIIIVNYNGEKYLPELLGSIFEFAPKNAFQQVIVVDNYSIDGSVEYVKSNYPQVLLMKMPKNLGFAAGNNIAIRHALKNGFDYVMLLNQDTIVTRNYLDKLISTLENEQQCACVQPKILLYPDVNLLNSLGNKIHYLGFGYTYGHRTSDNGKLENNVCLNYCSGAACLIKASALRDCGLFDENLFMYHEDLDLGWRFLLLGYKNRANYSSVVFHKYDFSRSIKKYYFMERNRFYVILKNYSAGTFLLILPALVIMEIGLLVVSFKNGWWREKLMAYFYFLMPSAWHGLFKSRALIQGSRRMKDIKTITDFSGKIEHQEVSSLLVDNVLNPIFHLYWKLIKLIIYW